MWPYLSGPFLAAGALLLAAGVPKLRDPMPLVRALRSAGLPAGRPAVRVIAAAEVLVGGAALVAPSALTAALVALAYLGFTAFVGLALARGGILGSCGCFGKADTPPTTAHLGLTALAAVTATAVALDPPAQAWSAGTATVAGSVVGAGLIAFLAWQVLAVLPTVTPAAVRSTQKG